MNNFTIISDEVKSAIAKKEPIVALESTIISHGMPFPQNEQTALEVEDIVRSNGATPATVAVIKGKLKVGLNRSEIKDLSTKPGIIKMSKSNLYTGILRKKSGSTTVAATLIACKFFGLEFFATGGIGGVHRNIEELDISADLFELANANCTVVCSGPKAILDIPKTIEVLEAFGIPVITYKHDQIPSFWSRDSKLNSTIVSHKVEEIAAMHNLRKELNVTGCQLIANPIEKKFQIKKEVIEPIIKNSIKIMEKKNITGKDVTPFLLKKIAEETEGASLKTNIELIKSNADLAAKIAKKACINIKI